MFILVNTIINNLFFTIAYENMFLRHFNLSHCRCLSRRLYPTKCSLFFFEKGTLFSKKYIPLFLSRFLLPFAFFLLIFSLHFYSFATLLALLFTVVFLAIFFSIFTVQISCIDTRVQAFDTAMTRLFTSFRKRVLTMYKNICYIYETFSNLFCKDRNARVRVCDNATHRRASAKLAG